jgi:hypothetical protein
VESYILLIGTVVFNVEKTHIAYDYLLLVTLFISPYPLPYICDYVAVSATATGFLISRMTE